MTIGRNLGNDWRNAIWKLISNPALEVVAAILLVVLATWVVVSTETEQNKTLFPVPYGAHR